MITVVTEHILLQYAHIESKNIIPYCRGDYEIRADGLRKNAQKLIDLGCGDYFSVAFGEGKFDCAVSFQTMHHFTHKKKTELYGKIRKALKNDGVYVECDYMVETQEEEDRWFAENERIRREQNIPFDEFFHYDTPCTTDNQISMLKKAGFIQVEMVFRMENTTILVARR